jgi:hypothetical protein
MVARASLLGPLDRGFLERSHGQFDRLAVDREHLVDRALDLLGVAVAVLAAGLLGECLGAAVGLALRLAASLLAAVADGIDWNAICELFHGCLSPDSFPMTSR